MSAPSSSVLTVGLLGINGNLGSVLFQHLLKAHQAKQLELVVLHRPSSDTSSVPSEVDKRVLDLEKGTKEDLESAIKGLQVVISNVASVAVLQQLALVDALAGSPDLITFIPSEFGGPWTKEELADPRFAFLDVKTRITERAAELDVPTTVVKTGTFDLFVFGYGAGGINIKKNELTWYDGAKTGKAYISSLDFIGAALVHELITNVKSLPGTTLSLYNFNPTGEEVYAAFEKVNGKAPKVVEFTEAEYQAALDKDPGSAIGAAIIKKWGTGQEFKGKVINTVEGYKQLSLEEYIKQYV